MESDTFHGDFMVDLVWRLSGVSQFGTNHTFSEDHVASANGR